MKTLPLLLLIALVTACGQTGGLLLPSGEPPTPRSAEQIGEPAEDGEDDEEKKAKPDDG